MDKKPCYLYIENTIPHPDLSPDHEPKCIIVPNSLTLISLSDTQIITLLRFTPPSLLLFCMCPKHRQWNLTFPIPDMSYWLEFLYCLFGDSLASISNVTTLCSRHWLFITLSKQTHTHTRLPPCCPPFPRWMPSPCIPPHSRASPWTCEDDYSSIQCECQGCSHQHTESKI